MPHLVTAIGAKVICVVTTCTLMVPYQLNSRLELVKFSTTGARKSLEAKWQCISRLPFSIGSTVLLSQIGILALGSAEVPRIALKLYLESTFAFSFGMTQASDLDENGLGGSNTNYISAHCEAPAINMDNVNFGHNQGDGPGRLRGVSTTLDACRAMVGTLAGKDGCGILYAAYGASGMCHTYCDYYGGATTEHSDKPVRAAWQLQQAARTCEVFDNWRKKWLGSQVEMQFGNIQYGAVVADWNACVGLCRSSANCTQAVFNKHYKYCFGMSQASDLDENGLGGSNTNFISAHCEATTTLPQTDKSGPGQVISSGPGRRPSRVSPGQSKSI